MGKKTKEKIIIINHNYLEFIEIPALDTQHIPTLDILLIVSIFNLSKR